MNQQWQTDLVDIANIKTIQRWQYFPFDSHRRVLEESMVRFAEEKKNKLGSSLRAAYRRLLNENDGPPSVQTDQGK